jgi:diguanylate cyclase (GGDEF)-like protein/PAS domain S-box-containing protein
VKSPDALRSKSAKAALDPIANAALLNALPSLVWCLGADGLCSFVNRAWTDFTGRTIEQELDDGWLEGVHREDRDPLTQSLRNAFGARKPFKAEYRLRRADGGYGWVHHAAGPVNDGEGRFTGYLGTCHDITERHDAELAASERERMMRVLADNLPAQIAYYEGKTLRCLFANKAYARANGWDEQSILGRTVPEVIGQEANRLIDPYVQRVLAKEAVSYERPFVMPSGEERVIEVNLIPHLSETGEMLAAFVLISDITRHRIAERTIRESEERLRKFSDATREGIVFHDKGIITDCNEALSRIVGYTHDELVGTEILQYNAPEFRELVANHINSGMERPYEGAVLHKDGRRIPVELVGKEMPYKGQHMRMTVVRDISDRKDAEARIQFLAHHDTLTGLPNRVMLMDRLEVMLASARRRSAPIGILFIDLDHFKTVNDSLGHAAGDALLKIVAGRIESSLREVDVVSRLGGDEFLVALPDVEGERGAAQVAEKLLAAVSEPASLEGRTLSVSPSIGISVFPRDGATADALIKNADAAMYLAKERGRSNYQFFNEKLSEAAFQALTLETGLREAIRDAGFVLHYQPAVRVADRTLTAVEALIRWPRHDGTLAGPDEFVPVAEQRGLIIPIGMWVLNEACRQNKAWQDAGLPKVPVAINLSALQFRQKNLVSEVARVLSETGLEPKYLEIELTESMLMDDSGAMASTLDGLKALGVKLVIDDFGTGHSSLVHLKRFPLDKLKIDRGFVRDIPDDPDDVAITTAIIDLARNMGIVVVAEGVEKKEQLAFLAERGCDEMQGFLVCPALPPVQAAVQLARLGKR